MGGVQLVPSVCAPCYGTPADRENAAAAASEVAVSENNYPSAVAPLGAVDSAMPSVAVKPSPEAQKTSPSPEESQVIVKKEGLATRVSCVLEGTGVSPMKEDGQIRKDESQWPEGEEEEGQKEEGEQVTVNAEAVLKRASVSSEQQVPQADFTGYWKMIRCEGDFDGFLKENGIGWAMRTAASAAGFGVNATYHRIEQAEGTIHIETKNPKGTFIKDFRLDASEQDDVDPISKAPIKVIPYWRSDAGASNAVLMIEAYKPQPKGDPQLLPTTLRYMSGQEMIVEQVSPRKISVKRVFIKQ